jgi:hypothetical protein
VRLWTNLRWVLVFFAGFSLLCSPVSRGQSPVAGSYVCAQVSVAGKSAKCTSPPLILNSDGSYQLRGAEGHYSVRGQWLVLSNTKSPSRGKLQTGHRIVFRYREHGKLCEITFERRRADLGDSSLS